MSHEDFCPTHLCSLEETDRGEYVCPECGPVEADVMLSVGELAAEARCLADNNERMRADVVAIMRMEHELPAEVMARLSQMNVAVQPCSMCGKRLGTKVHGVGDTFACPPCRRSSFAKLGGAA